MKSSIELVHVDNGKPFTNTVIVAENCELEHASVIKLVRKYQADFEEFGPSRFQIAMGKRKQGGGKAFEYASLNEDQATYLITLFRNTDAVRAFKLRLVKEFRRVINELNRIKSQKSTIDWQQAREQGKVDRKRLAAAIAKLEGLAISQGGQKFDNHGEPTSRNYHATVTKMVYRCLFGDASLRNVRNQLDALKLQFLDLCELACTEEIERLVELGVDYHDIYVECKRRVIIVTDGLAKTGLIGDKDSAVRLAWVKST
jgi:phage regulator Rha-like protein